MENLGQKRTGSGDELPADKRACNSFEFRPSCSNSFLPTPMESTNSTLEAHDGDMDTSSHHSGSTRSDGDGEGEVEKDSAYGSCDSDGELRENSLSYHQRQRSVDDHQKLMNLLASFSQEAEESRILAFLTELCELLSFCTDGSISSGMADSFSSILVKYARHESNPDIMLLALRALTYLCDVHPRSSSFLVRHDAVPALCQRLMAIEYLDVAEQCLQALDKIAHEQPLACLQSGAIMAVLTYIDFFSTSLQRVALSTVVNICEKLPSEYSSPFMDAVPTLCNLLQYEDKQIVENASTCLIKIVERVRHSTDMLGELCKHGLVHQAINFIDLNCRTILCRPVCTGITATHLCEVLRSIAALTPRGLIGLLVKLASGSIVAARTLFELNVSRILKNVLLTYDLSQHMPSVNVVDGHCNQVQEVLKLLNELLPSADKDNSDTLNMEKQSFLTNEPANLQKFGTDMLPILIQVFDSGASVDICYGSLAVIRKFIYFSEADILVHLLKEINFSSFLAGVFTRKDQHVLMLALQIVNTVMQKVPDIFSSFLKEGVLFAVDSLLMPEKSSQFMFGVSQPSSATRQKSAARVRCLCYAFDTGQSPDSAKKPCKFEQDSIYNLAKQIKTTYFATETLYPDQGVTDVLLKLRALATALKDLVNESSSKVECREKKVEFGPVLHQIMAQLYSSDHTSTFEIIESGILKELVNYLSGDHYGRNGTRLTSGLDQGYSTERRSEVFGRLFLSSSDAPQPQDGFPLSVLVQKLHTALSSVENFPVIRSLPYRQRNSYATVPNGRHTSYPCLRVQFIRGERETCLSDHSQDAVTVDPFTSLDTIERYLWPKISNRHAKPPANQAKLTLQRSPSGLPSDMSSPCGNTPDLMECNNTSDVQEDKLEVPQPVHDGSNTARQATSDTTASSEVPTDHVENLQHISLEEDTSTCSKCCGHSSDDGTSPKLLFYLEEQHLDRSLSLYQAILERQINSEHENVDSAKLWSEVYKVTYRSAAKSVLESEDCSSHDSERSRMYWQFPPLSSGFSISSLEKSNPLYDILFLLKSLEQINRLQFHLISRERITDFVEGKLDNLDSLKERTSVVPQNHFLSSKLTEKLEQQMQDPLALSIGGIPSWCTQLMTLCPFLFSFEARCKYFRLTAFGQPQAQQPPTSSNDAAAGGSNGRRQNPVPRKKFLVFRDRILESASQMMNQYAHQKAVLEVEYNEEVGTGLGPTLEFYTLVSREFQKYSLGMWRGDHNLAPISSLLGEDSKIMDSCDGLFPRPWSPNVQTIGDLEFSEVVKKFTLLGKVVGKALQDGRFLDIPFSRAFYKLILGQELNVYDIHAFDPELGRALLEFQAVVERNRFLKSVRGENEFDSGFRDTAIKDLCLDFTLPGYPDFSLTSGPASELVNATNLEEYVSLVVDATISAGVRRQVEAFRSGFNQVFPISHLKVFTEEELERLLCGEHDLFCSDELLDHIKVDHGYSVSSPPITNLLEIIREFDREQQRAFLQFATGTPRLPPGGLASLNPKLTIVRKHSSRNADDDLPSVMTCANYLKLPPYSSKEKMKEKLVYAITEGQGSFHLS